MNEKSVLYTEATAICKNCGVEFQAKVYRVLGHEIPQEYCRECSDKVLAQEKQSEDAKRQLEISAQRRRWRENCGIDDKNMVKGFATFKIHRPGNIAEVYRLCVQYADNFPIEYDAWRRKSGKAYPSLLLFSVGVWGNGKTHLVSSIAHRILVSKQIKK